MADQQYSPEASEKTDYDNVEQCTPEPDVRFGSDHIRDRTATEAYLMEGLAGRTGGIKPDPRRRRDGIYGAVEERLRHAVSEADKANGLARLADLLRKYPEVAEILDLKERYGF